MKIEKNKIIASLTALSALAALAPITGNNDWLTFLSFLSFYSFIKVNMDERMKTNIDRAARNGFIASLVCLSALMFYVTSSPSTDRIVFALEISLATISIVASISFTVYDKFAQ